MVGRTLLATLCFAAPLIVHPSTSSHEYQPGQGHDHPSKVEITAYHSGIVESTQIGFRDLLTTTPEYLQNASSSSSATERPLFSVDDRPIAPSFAVPRISEKGNSRFPHLLDP